MLHRGGDHNKSPNISKRKNDCKLEIVKSVYVAIGADLASIVVFAALGRDAHQETVNIWGVAQTAWPFLVGGAAGWIACKAWRNPLKAFPSGVVIAASAVAVGMTLRVLTGGSAPIAFIIVASSVLLTFVAGWRLATTLVRRYFDPSRKHAAGRP